MTSVINIRGANGSGKSYLVRRWIVSHNGVAFPRYASVLGGDFSNRHPTHYVLADSGVVVGAYTHGCGGCDRVRTTEEIRDRIRKNLSPDVPYLIFEGVIVSTVFSSWMEFGQTIPGKFYWVFLDTPLEVCLERVRCRNNGAPFKKELVAAKVKSIAATRKKAIAAGERVVDLHWETAEQDFQNFMGSVL